ncbi:response regulator [Novosphingobium sp. JCM 18896]|uniref:response regulator n=1 Tax=Novosphingobium sp. JCM 18896 TaxID=2989731 RepID=UPI002222A9A1|nr:response regulator [Novosphingobium sp. JCM 18896]MCW1430866.1 response regulator [Novosphingobium sp. JCM 18896]
MAINVLLVEDDDDIREVLTLALHLDSEISLTAYHSGEAALADIAERQLAFDVALLDYRLPGMTGIELHKALRRLPSCCDLVTVMITASLGKEYVALFQAENIAGLISKPFDVLAIPSEVRALTQPRQPKGNAIKWLTERIRTAS